MRRSQVTSNYRNLFWLETFKKAVGPLRRPLGRGLTALGKLANSRVFSKYGPLLSANMCDYYLSRASSPYQFFNQVKNNQLYTHDMLRESDKGRSFDVVRKYLSHASEFGLLERMLYVDTKTWLPDDLLVKADKMTMANSVELRVPFLDHKVLEFAANLPRHQKLRGTTMKYLAKKALRKHVPAEILKRRKAGFPVPYDSWLRTNLRSEVKDILLDPTTTGRGYFQKRTIEALIQKQQSGAGYAKEIFALVVLELWHRIFVDEHSTVKLDKETTPSLCWNLNAVGASVEQ